MKTYLKLAGVARENSLGGWKLRQLVCVFCVVVTEMPNMQKDRVYVITCDALDGEVDRTKGLNLLAAPGRWAELRGSWN